MSRSVWLRAATCALGCVLLVACSQDGAPPPSNNTGAKPKIGPPTAGLIPTVHIPRPAPWPKGRMPVAPAGFVVNRFASELMHPRWIYVLPNGDVLAAESATEPTPPGAGILDRITGMLEERSGAVMKSPDTIVLLRDANGDGIAETRSVFLTPGTVHQPYGMALIADRFFVGGTDGVWRFAYHPGDMKVGAGTKIASVPGGGGHWARNVIASEDGAKLYVAVGSSTNIADNGMGPEKNRADILQMNPDGTGLRVFTAGTRNPNGMAWEPTTHVLWTVVNERDMLGDDLVPDYLTRATDGAFYGWPYSYWGHHVDDRVQPQRPDLVAKAIPPDYALGSHVAALGLAFYTANVFPEHYSGGAFIGEHGSWNRNYLVGYKVVFVPFANGMPSGTPEDFLTGFIPDPHTEEVYGRPVGIAVDHSGALLVADDNGNTIWRVSSAAH